jgi:hypothetical protein
MRWWQHARRHAQRVGSMRAVVVTRHVSHTQPTAHDAACEGTWTHTSIARAMLGMRGQMHGVHQARAETNTSIVHVARGKQTSKMGLSPCMQWPRTTARKPATVRALPAWKRGRALAMSQLLAPPTPCRTIPHAFTCSCVFACVHT